MSTTKNFSIGMVSELTGVNSITLRAWERRYGLIQPQRTPKGHRLYSDEDIKLIETILDQLQQGSSISKVSDRLKNQPSPQTDSSFSDSWASYRQKMITAIAQFDESVLDSIYNDTMSLYPVDVVTKKLIMPLLSQLGDRWEAAQGDSTQAPVAEEHFFSVFFRNKLGARFHHKNVHNNGPLLITACLPGESHEFGLLLFSLAAHARGYRLILLGADMPLSELAIVTQRRQADGLVLSGSKPLAIESITKPLMKLEEQINLPIFIGGEITEKLQAHPLGNNTHLIGSDMVEGLQQIRYRLN